MQTVLVVFAIGFIFGAIGAYIAEKKEVIMRVFLGFLFGLLGVIAEIFLPKKPKENKLFYNFSMLNLELEL